MIIKIDTREQELYKKCELFIESVIKFKDIKLVYEPLPLGDIIINLNGVNFTANQLNLKRKLSKFYDII